MIRFVDLTTSYWTDGGRPCCAFLNTVSDRFIAAEDTHVFDSLDDVRQIDPDLRDRCLALVPEGFFDER